MKKFLTKSNFIIGIVSVLITFIPGKLIGEFATIILRMLVAGFNKIMSILDTILPIANPYVRGFSDVLLEGFATTFFGSAAGVYITIFVPIIIFKKFTKININWLPAILLLIPMLAWTGFAQIVRYAELYIGLMFIVKTLGYTIGSFMPLYYAYIYTKRKK